MRTLALNSNLPNFKALHIPRDRYFSPAQTNILNDIEKKVSQAPLDTIDFYAEPRKKDSLELFIYDKEADPYNNRLCSGVCGYPRFVFHRHCSYAQG